MAKGRKANSCVCCNKGTGDYTCPYCETHCQGGKHVDSDYFA